MDISVKFEGVHAAAPSSSNSIKASLQTGQIFCQKHSDVKSSKKKRRKKPGRPPSTPKAKLTGLLGESNEDTSKKHDIYEISNRKSLITATDLIESKRGDSNSMSSVGGTSQEGLDKSVAKTLNRDTIWQEMEAFFRPLTQQDFKNLQETVARCKDLERVSNDAKVITRKRKPSGEQSIAGLRERLIKIAASNADRLEAIQGRIRKWDKAETVEKKLGIERRFAEEYKNRKARKELFRRLRNGVRDVEVRTLRGVKTRNLKIFGSPRRSEPNSTSGDYIAATEKDEGGCGVCFEIGDVSAQMNPMLMCTRCGLFVHKGCYGVDKVPLNSWYCDFCLPLAPPSGGHRAGKPRRPRVSHPPDRCGASPDSNCALCPVPGGALKASVDNAWVHLACALWIPGMEIGDLVNMSDIRGVREALMTRATDREADNAACEVCERPVGATLKCSHKTCGKIFHPLCAWFAGHYMRVEDHYAKNKPRRASGNEPRKGSGGGQCDFFIYCQKHVPKEASKRNASVQSEMRRMGQRRQQEYREQSRKKQLEKLQQSEIIEDLYEHNRCAVCFEKGSTSDNRLMKCRKCQVETHQRCYGILDRDLEGVEDWICDRCKSRKNRVKPVSCALCPRRGGAFKPTVDHKWVHVTCAQWIPEARILDFNVMAPIDLADVPKSRFHHKCYLCNQRQGACLGCAEQCDKSFHVLCGLLSGGHMGSRSMPALMGGNEENALMGNKGNEEDGQRTQLLTVCCLAHTPLLILRKLKVPEDYLRLLLLRHHLVQTRSILSRVLRREQAKRDIARIDTEMFTRTCKAVHSRTGTFRQLNSQVHEWRKQAKDGSLSIPPGVGRKRESRSTEGLSPRTRGPVAILRRIGKAECNFIRIEYTHNDDDEVGSLENNYADFANIADYQADHGDLLPLEIEEGNGKQDRATKISGDNGGGPVNNAQDNTGVSALIETSLSNKMKLTPKALESFAASNTVGIRGDVAEAGRGNTVAGCKPERSHASPGNEKPGSSASLAKGMNKASRPSKKVSATPRKSLSPEYVQQGSKAATPSTTKPIKALQTAKPPKLTKASKAVKTSKVRAPKTPKNVKVPKLQNMKKSKGCTTSKTGTPKTPKSSTPTLGHGRKVGRPKKHTSKREITKAKDEPIARKKESVHRKNKKEIAKNKSSMTANEQKSNSGATKKGGKSLKEKTVISPISIVMGTSEDKAQLRKKGDSGASRNSKRKLPPGKGSVENVRKKRKGVAVQDLVKKKLLDKKISPTKLKKPLAVGDKVLVRNGKRAYEAFIVEVRVLPGKPKGPSPAARTKYLIHYHGWNKRYDEWLPSRNVLQLLVRAEDMETEDAS
eukprot:CAMPEP_0184506702 /NCGR_PEP_ID=MMETSP0113_2-20130426/53636_1 /TAXON_ID=91329 /ORGANISM="Norrisiella sphaerica, Strain BC52" /LENGTH=1334 /DNA_ID=CAMNT_0026896427 /DNA_START=698 /DNA_END=4702 /DNA_ORIENTATION=-